MVQGKHVLAAYVQLHLLFAVMQLAQLQKHILHALRIAAMQIAPPAQIQLAIAHATLTMAVQ